MQVSGFTLPTDDRIKVKVSQLVDDGVFSVVEMKRHLLHYIRTDIFAGQDMPPSTNGRFFPSSRILRNMIYRARVKKMHSKVDQQNLQVNISKWQADFPQSMFFFRPYQEPDSNDGDTSSCNDDDDDEVSVTSSANGLLFCHQTQWQQQLLAKYGQEICLLDATYKTSKYALPLFFVCVKTNVDYVVVASFISQSESASAISEGLGIIKQWNPKWQSRTWMVDFCEMEIIALQTVFPGKPWYCIHRLQ